MFLGKLNITKVPRILLTSEDTPVCFGCFECTLDIPYMLNTFYVTWIIRMFFVYFECLLIVRMLFDTSDVCGKPGRPLEWYTCLLSMSLDSLRVVTLTLLVTLVYSVVTLTLLVTLVYPVVTLTLLVTLVYPVVPGYSECLLILWVSGYTNWYTF